jgi:hypothetical protein
VEINNIKILGKMKDKIIINDNLVYVLKLRKEKLWNNSERVSLTAKRLGYTTEGIIKKLKWRKNKIN